MNHNQAALFLSYNELRPSDMVAHPLLPPYISVDHPYHVEEERFCFKGEQGDIQQP